MSEPMVAAESGPLSFDAAVSSLVTPEPEAPIEADAPEVEPEPEIEAESTAADEDGEAVEPDADAQDEEADEPAVAQEAPAYWTQDAKAKFAELSPELQAVVLSQEGPREEAAAKVRAAATEYRQQADAEVAKVQVLAESLNRFLPQAMEAFKDKWADVDWAAWADQDPEAAFKGKIAYDAEQKLLEEVKAATKDADEQAHIVFLKAETAKLPEIAPDLADPVKGPERRTKVAQHLLSMGIPAEALRTISAVEMGIAYDAMRYREAKAGLSTAPKPKTAPVKPVVRPAAAVAPQNRTAQATNRFAQTRSVDDAVALLLSRG